MIVPPVNEWLYTSYDSASCERVIFPVHKLSHKYLSCTMSLQGQLNSMNLYLVSNTMASTRKPPQMSSNIEIQF